MRLVNPTRGEKVREAIGKLKGVAIAVIVALVMVTSPIILSLVGMQSRYWLVTTGILLAGVLLVGIWLLRYFNQDDEEVPEPKAMLLVYAFGLVVVGTSIFGHGAVWVTEILWPPGPSAEAEAKRLVAEEAERRRVEIRTPVRDPGTGHLVYHALYGAQEGTVAATTTPTTVGIQGPFFVKTPRGGNIPCWSRDGVEVEETLTGEPDDKRNVSTTFKPIDGKLGFVTYWYVPPDGNCQPTT